MIAGIYHPPWKLNLPFDFTNKKRLLTRYLVQIGYLAKEKDNNNNKINIKSSRITFSPITYPIFKIDKT